jgi:hypothetical protein
MRCALVVQALVSRRHDNKSQARRIAAHQKKKEARDINIPGPSCCGTGQLRPSARASLPFSLGAPWLLAAWCGAVGERGVLGSGRAEEAGRRWKFWRSGGMPGLCDGANGRSVPSPGLPFRRVTRNYPPAFCACRLLLCAKTAPSFAGEQPKLRRELFLRAVRLR